MSGQIIIIDGVRVREDEARERGIHPDQIRERAEAAQLKAEADEQARLEQEEADKAAFDALVQAAAEKLIADREAAVTATGEVDKGAAAKAVDPKNKAATPANK